MANPNAPHGAQPVAYINGSPWSGKANVYRIPAADALAYYIGDFVTTIGVTTGGDVNGVPDVKRAANGAVTSQQLRGVIVGIQVAPVGTGADGGAQNNTVNLNVMNVPASKLNDYYVFVADDPNLIFEIQGDNAATINMATGGAGATPIMSSNCGYTQAAPGTSFGPLSGSVLTTASFATTSTLPLKVVGIPQRVNITVGTAFTPFLVEINTHELGHGPGTTAV
jgi:hypothetical protein